MAGYDAHFKFLPHDEPLVRAMFAAGRRRGRPFNVQWSSRIYPNRATAWCGLDGPSFGLDICLERLRRDWPSICEATPSRRPPSERRAVAGGLVEIMTRYRLSLYDRHPADWLPTLRALRQPIRPVVHELYCSGNDRVQDRLMVTMDLMASWHLNEVAPEVLIEELHTAAELMLEETVNRRSKRLSFEQLVRRADELGQLGTGRPEDRGWFGHPTPKDVDVLLSLKDIRKRVRHRGETGARGWLEEHFWQIGLLLERMAATVPAADSPAAPEARPRLAPATPGLRM